MTKCEHCKRLLEHLEEIPQGRSSWEWDEPRISYVEIQIEKDELIDIARTLAEKEQEERKAGPAIPPGETIIEMTRDKEISLSDLAASIGLSERGLSKLLEGEMSIWTGLAKSLENALGAPASFWIKLDENYQKEKEIYQERGARDMRNSASTAEYEVGFLVVRTVEAENPEEARVLAIKQLREDISDGSMTIHDDAPAEYIFLMDP